VTTHLVAADLVDLLKSGKFDAQSDLGTLLLAIVHGGFVLPA
jgi:hypothetical protein